MSLLIGGLILFFAAHSVSVVGEAWRDRVASKMGEAAWQGAYSLVALAGLTLIVWGYGAARLDPLVLYVPPPWTRHAAMALLAPVFPLLLAAYLPGRIQRATKHPMLVATKLWATAHLLANGTAADVLLFGSFLAWAVADRISLARRTPRPVRGAPPSPINDASAIVLGLALYVGFALWLHPLLIGVPVMPR